MDSAAKMELAWKNERKWFSRTLVASLVSLLSFFGVAGAFWWGLREAKAISSRLPSTLTPSSSDQLDQLNSSFHFIQIVCFASLSLLLISGLIFLFFLIRWLFAIGSRRKVMATVGGPG